uniref:Uncharacterized protein n=1 Tax=Octopus bimaculoides TaxID=37653 RepID=A0A0L8GEJ6_OCTBM
MGGMCEWGYVWVVRCVGGICEWGNLYVSYICTGKKSRCFRHFSSSYVIHRTNDLYEHLNCTEEEFPQKYFSAMIRRSYVSTFR